MSLKGIVSKLKKQMIIAKGFRMLDEGCGYLEIKYELGITFEEAVEIGKLYRKVHHGTLTVYE